MKKYTVPLAISALLIISGCATFQSPPQPPKVLEKGELSLTLSAGALRIADHWEFDDGRDDFVVYCPWFDVSAVFRTYVAKHLDAGLQLTESTGQLPWLRT